MSLIWLYCSARGFLYCCKRLIVSSYNIFFFCYVAVRCRWWENKVVRYLIIKLFCFLQIYALRWMWIIVIECERITQNLLSLKKNKIKLTWRRYRIDTIESWMPYAFLWSWFIEVAFHRTTIIILSEQLHIHNLYKYYWVFYTDWSQLVLKIMFPQRRSYIYICVFL